MFKRKYTADQSDYWPSNCFKYLNILVLRGATGGDFLFPLDFAVEDHAEGTREGALFSLRECVDLLINKSINLIFEH